jgi:hypothetical protein
MTPEALALRDRIADVLHAYPDDFGLTDVDEIPTWDAITLADAVMEVIEPLMGRHLAVVK